MPRRCYFCGADTACHWCGTAVDEKLDTKAKFVKMARSSSSLVSYAPLVVWSDRSMGRIPKRFSGPRTAYGVCKEVLVGWKTKHGVAYGWLEIDRVPNHCKVVNLYHDADPRMLRLAESLGHEWRIPGQVDGYWFEEKPTRRKPDYASGNALYFGERGDCAIMLCWGQSTYEPETTTWSTRAQHIARGEKLFFVAYEDDPPPRTGPQKRRVWQASGVIEMPIDEAKECFPRGWLRFLPRGKDKVICVKVSKWIKA